MTFQHQTLADGRWYQLTLVEQLANIGSEIFRTISWKNKNNPDYSTHAFHRALELCDLTLQDPKHSDFHRLRELTRVREALVDYFAGQNLYHSSDQLWQKYFHPFTYAARSQT
jgi:hypothetical protein